MGIFRTHNEFPSKATGSHHQGHFGVQGDRLPVSQDPHKTCSGGFPKFAIPQQHPVGGEVAQQDGRKPCTHGLRVGDLQPHLLRSLFPTPLPAVPLRPQHACPQKPLCPRPQQMGLSQSRGQTPTRSRPPPHHAPAHRGMFPEKQHILHVLQGVQQEVVAPLLPVNRHGAIAVHAGGRGWVSGQRADRWLRVTGVERVARWARMGLAGAARVCGET